MDILAEGNRVFMSELMEVLVVGEQEMLIQNKVSPMGQVLPEQQLIMGIEELAEPILVYMDAAVAVEELEELEEDMVSQVLDLHHQSLAQVKLMLAVGLLMTKKL